MPAIDVNSKTIELPTSVSEEIITKLQEGSAVMSLARYMDLPGLGTTIPVITGDPEAEWTSETEEKKVSRPGLSKKVMQAYTLAVIVPFSNQFRKNMPALYKEIVQRLPMALAKKFDSTVFHGTAPGSNFDTFASCTAQAFGNDPYAAFVAADADVSDHGGISNGIVIAPQGKSKLLLAKDNDGRPLFINNVSENAIPMVLGNKTLLRKAAYKDDTKDVLGVMGDWTQAIYGVSTDISMSLSDQATLTDGDQTINLWQRNMFAVRAEIEVGFVADTACFNLLTE